MKRPLFPLLVLSVIGWFFCAACTGDKSLPITPEGILEDLRSPRVKQVVIDSDTYNEMDDQYAIAYAIASEKMEVLALHAAPFHNNRSTSFEEGMELSFKEMQRVLEVVGHKGDIPVFEGARKRVSDDPESFDPENPASRNLVDIARKARKPVYVLTLGALTNVAAALKLDPSIKDKIVVVWLGTNCFSKGHLNEFNLVQDYVAGQRVVDSGVPLVILPALGHHGEGTMVLVIDQDDVKTIQGDGRAQVFFRSELPQEFHDTQGDWQHILWDIAAPGLIANPQDYHLRIIPAPILTAERKFAFDSTRHPVVWMDSLDPEPIRSDLFRCISSYPKE